MKRAAILRNFWLVGVALLLPLPAAHAALPIDLEIAVVKAAPSGAMQAWGRLLSDKDLARVRLRGAHAGDEPSLSESGQGGNKRYRLVGILNHRDELILPGGRFGQGDQAALQRFLEELPQRTEEAKVERGAFGLTKPQFEQVHADLSTVVEASTKDVAREAAVAAMLRSFKTPVEYERSAREMLRRAKPLAAELKGMTAGTAAAIALRGAGLGLVPQQPRGQPLALRIAPLAPEPRGWPTGWKPQRGPRQVAPAMYRVTMVEIEGFTLAQALDSLAPHLGLPVIFDERTLATRGIEPEKVEVKFPAGKTYIRRAVDRILSQGRLAGELRVDEAGRPFYWATQFTKDSPRATN